jgi:hypothetical protein
METIHYLTDPKLILEPTQEMVIKSFLLNQKIKNLEIEIPPEKICYEESEDDSSSDICLFIDQQDIEAFCYARKILNQIIWEDLKQKGPIIHIHEPKEGVTMQSLMDYTSRFLDYTNLILRPELYQVMLISTKKLKNDLLILHQSECNDQKTTFS